MPKETGAGGFGIFFMRAEAGGGANVPDVNLLFTVGVI